MSAGSFQDMDEPLPEYIGPYRVIRKLGEGGMGAVFEAVQQPIDRSVAVKTLHPSHARNQRIVARFLNEAKALGKLQHPSVVQVIDYGTTPEGIAYLAMEFLRGESLARRLKTLNERRAVLPFLTTLQIGFQVADALAVAHANGIVHRDAYEKTMTCFRVSAKDTHRRRKSHGYSKAEDSSYLPLQLV